MASNEFVKALKRRREISITVTGRRTGRAITIPVWFVADDSGIYLLPVYGSETQWYKNLEKDRNINIDAGTTSQDFRAMLLKDPQAITQVIQQFREKYKPEEIERWYKGFDVAVQIPITA
jgi:deazaflavin-dependent oxidoreductase (nitroreductase family)